MGIYRTICYKVEDVFVKMITKQQEPSIVREKVAVYRSERENKKSLKGQKYTTRTQRSSNSKSV
jgi:hypothetical protein